MTDLPQSLPQAWRPPMGWNSWDSYGTTLTEDELLANARFMAEHLKNAGWGGPKDIAPYIDPVFDNNILLTQTERLTMNNRPKDPKTARNKNVLVIGGSGSGKTRFFVKPNLMQCVSKDYPTSFVITDPKGSL